MGDNYVDVINVTNIIVSSSSDNDDRNSFDVAYRVGEMTRKYHSTCNNWDRDNEVTNLLLVYGHLNKH